MFSIAQSDVIIQNTRELSIPLLGTLPKNLANICLYARLKLLLIAAYMIQLMLL